MFDVFRRSLTVIRQQPGQYVNGVWQPGSEETLTIRASVQPTSPDDIERLPEGRRERQAFTLYSSQALRIIDESEETNADIVEIDGQRYEATARQPWQNNLINHHRTIVTRISE
jgi:hypothetical protein